MKALIKSNRMIHVASNLGEKQRTYGCSKPFFVNYSPIWCYCGHVIKSRTMRHLNFDCQLNLSKSHKVWSSYLVPFRRSVEKFGWGGAKNAPPPCEIGLNSMSELFAKRPVKKNFMPSPEYPATWTRKS